MFVGTRSGDWEVATKISAIEVGYQMPYGVTDVAKCLPRAVRKTNRAIYREVIGAIKAL